MTTQDSSESRMRVLQAATGGRVNTAPDGKVTTPPFPFHLIRMGMETSPSLVTSTVPSPLTHSVHHTPSSEMRLISTESTTCSPSRSDLGAGIGAAALTWVYIVP